MIASIRSRAEILRVQRIFAITDAKEVAKERQPTQQALLMRWLPFPSPFPEKLILRNYLKHHCPRLGLLELCDHHYGCQGREAQLILVGG
jgi:hypothetical protein